jgi:hypothetical protein
VKIARSERRWNSPINITYRRSPFGGPTHTQWLDRVSCEPARASTEVFVTSSVQQKVLCADLGPLRRSEQPKEHKVKVTHLRRFVCHCRILCIEFVNPQIQLLAFGLGATSTSHERVAVSQCAADVPARRQPRSRDKASRIHGPSSQSTARTICGVSFALARYE